MEIFNTHIEYLKKTLESVSDVVITSHYNPDGDAIGSCLALYSALNNIGIKVHVIIPNEMPNYLKWLPEADKICIFSANEDACRALIKNTELIFCMDYNSLGRVKLFTEELKNSTVPRVLIDHHISPENDFDYMFSTTEVSSTCELLYNVLIHSAHLKNITPQIAECLFVGIMTDTGSFSYSCNRADTFEITAKLINHGIDVEKIHRKVYDTYSENRMRLLGYCLGPKLKVIPQHATAYIWLTKADLDKYNYQQGDTEGVVNYALSIENVAMAALFTERDDRIRVSLRSKGDYSVNELARKYFNGGGHKNAAGGDIFKTMNETLAWFESLLPAESEALHLSLAEYK